MFVDKMINIHPSLLPEYKGLDTHKRVLKDKKVIHGASVHAVNKFIDGGSILCRGFVPVLKKDNEITLAKRVMEIEIIIYPYSIAAILSGAVSLYQGSWVDGTADHDFPNLDFKKNYHHLTFEI